MSGAAELPQVIIEVLAVSEVFASTLVASPTLSAGRFAQLLRNLLGCYPGSLAAFHIEAHAHFQS